jgi:CHAD domain-containing protein
MAFRFRLNEPIQKGFRRIGIEQLDRAERQLVIDGNPEKAVHETRKCLKRARALLRLVHPGLGDARFRTENARLRDIAALLAPARDSHILAETIAKLESAPGRSGNPAHAALAALRRIVQEDAQGVDRTPDASIAEALRKLGAAKKRLRRLDLHPATFAMLERGLEQSYRCARRAFRKAYSKGTDEAFHEWRKTVQQHWRHMALLSHAWPDLLGARVAAARTLSQILGDDHDLALLTAFAASLPPSRLPRSHAREIARLARVRQGELRKLAAPRGERLFVEGARGHSRRIGEMWRAAEEIGESEDEAETVHAPLPGESGHAAKVRT